MKVAKTGAENQGRTPQACDRWWVFSAFLFAGLGVSNYMVLVLTQRQPEEQSQMQRYQTELPELPEAQEGVYLAKLTCSGGLLSAP